MPMDHWQPEYAGNGRRLGQSHHSGCQCRSEPNSLSSCLTGTLDSSTANSTDTTTKSKPGTNMKHEPAVEEPLPRVTASGTGTMTVDVQACIMMPRLRLKLETGREVRFKTSRHFARAGGASTSHEARQSVCMPPSR
jgi:hypothetical protein